MVVIIKMLWNELKMKLGVVPVVKIESEHVF